MPLHRKNARLCELVFVLCRRERMTDYYGAGDWDTFAVNAGKKAIKHATQKERLERDYRQGISGFERLCTWNLVASVKPTRLTRAV